MRCAVRVCETRVQYNTVQYNTKLNTGCDAEKSAKLAAASPSLKIYSAIPSSFLSQTFLPVGLLARRCSLYCISEIRFSSHFSKLIRTQSN